MATTETKIILNAETGEAVKNVRELNDKIKELKASLNDENATAEENRETAHELAQAQATLRDVMNSSSEAAVANAKNVNVQTAAYNTLVHAMADLTKEWRATTDEVERAELGKKINEINTQLKEMDASKGTFSRNVGDYTNSIKQAFEGAELSASALGKGIKNVDTASRLMSTNPIMGILTLLLPVISSLVEKVKGTDTAMQAVNKALAAFEPIGNAVTKIVEKIAEMFAKAVGWIAEMAQESSGTFGKIVAGAVGVGNTILQFILTPIRSAIEAFKGLGEVVKDVFSGQWKNIKKDASEAISGISDAFKKGFDFKSNFESGRSAGEAFVQGLGNVKAEAKEQGQVVGKEFADAFKAEISAEMAALDKELEDSINKAEEEANARAERLAESNMDALDKQRDYQLRMNDIFAKDGEERAAREYEIIRASNEKKLEALKQYSEDALNRGDFDAKLEYDQQAADLSVEMELQALEEKKRIREQDLADTKAKEKAKISLMQSAASGVSSILSSLADIYEGDTEASEEELQKAKNLRIAGATIDMLNGVVTAISQAQSLGPIAGPIMAAINSASVIAAGVANIAKIKQQSTSSSSSSTTTPTTTSASVSAPAVEQQVQVYRNLTSDSEEDRLNYMANDQRVVLVMSDLEVAENQRKVQVNESSF